MPAKTRSSSPVKCSRCASRASASATRGAIGTERTLPDLRRRQCAVGVAGRHADVLTREVDLAPAESDQLALPQAGEGRGEEERGVLLVLGGTDERQDLLGREDVDPARAAPCAASRRRATGLGGSRESRARSITPWKTVIAFSRVRFASGRSRPSSARPALDRFRGQRPRAGRPNAAARGCGWSSRTSRSVDGLRWRSCSR